MPGRGLRGGDPTTGTCVPPAHPSHRPTVLSPAAGCLRGWGIHQLGKPPGVGGPVLREGTGEGAELLTARLDGAVNRPLAGPGSELLRLGDVAGDAGV